MTTDPVPSKPPPASESWQHADGTRDNQALAGTHGDANDNDQASEHWRPAQAKPERAKADSQMGDPYPAAWWRDNHESPFERLPSSFIAQHAFDELQRMLPQLAAMAGAMPPSSTGSKKGSFILDSLKKRGRFDHPLIDDRIEAPAHPPRGAADCLVPPRSA
ncbi:hypothetical protein FQA39_LY19317 [Lamprigera yunnana]|nr:hypothetical protein FQA39_LY19317 [Lamprigera yunnana]